MGEPFVHGSDWEPREGPPDQRRRPAGNRWSTAGTGSLDEGPPAQGRRQGAPILGAVTWVSQAACFARRLQPGPARPEHVRATRLIGERLIAAGASAGHMTARTGIGVPRMARRCGGVVAVESLNREADDPGDAALGEPAVRGADLASGVHGSVHVSKQALPKCQTRARYLPHLRPSTWQWADESKGMGRACGNLPVSCLNEGLSPASAEHMAGQPYPAGEAVKVYIRPEGCFGE